MAGIGEHDASSSAGSPATNITTPENHSENDDIWASDDEHHETNNAEQPGSRENMLSDLPTVKRQHMTDGYREGLSIGKAKVMQSGFDEGYPIGVQVALRVGKVLGCLEGILASKDLPVDIKTVVTKQYERAKDELAITSLLKGMDDQTVIRSNGVLDSVAEVLCRWEKVTFGATQQDSAGESQQSS